jgi:hypothetical protein
VTDPSGVRPLFVTAGDAALYLRIREGIEVEPNTIMQWARRRNILVRAGGGQARYELTSIVRWAKSSERNARAARRELGIVRHRSVAAPDDAA